MIRGQFASAALACALLAGCTFFDPYPTVPAPPKAGAAPGPRVAICYNMVTTGRTEVQQQAQKECAAGTVAEPADSDLYLQNCPLLLPAHASFVCTPKK